LLIGLLSDILTIEIQVKDVIQALTDDNESGIYLDRGITITQFPRARLILQTKHTLR